MSEESVIAITIRFDKTVHDLRFRLEEYYNIFYCANKDIDRVDFCAKLLGVVSTHKEAGRFITPKLVNVLDAVYNGKLRTLLSNERDYRETNLLLQTQFARSILGIDNKDNIDYSIHHDIVIPETDFVLKDTFDVMVFVESIKKFIEIKSVKPIFAGEW